MSDPIIKGGQGRTRSDLDAATGIIYAVLVGLVILFTVAAIWVLTPGD